MGLIDGLKEAVLKEIADNLLPSVDIKDKFRDWDSLSPELKDEFLEDEETINSNIEDQKEQVIKGMEPKWNNLSSSLNLLVNSSTQFVTRLAMVPTAIISTTPVGPGVAAGAIPQAIAQLKSDGETVGKAYDDTKNSLSEILGGYSGDSTIITDLKTTISTLLGTAAIALAVVGISKDGVEAQEPEVQSPVALPEYKAGDCKNYREIEQEDPVECENCENYNALNPSGTRACNNCTRYEKR